MTDTPAPVLFFGTPIFAAESLKRLLDHPELIKVVGVITQPDRPAGRGSASKGKKLTPSPVKELAQSHGIPVLTPNSVKKEIDQFLQELTALGPVELGIVAAFGQILPQRLLDYPRLGCLNVHGSLLPRWRGAAPIQRALLAGDQETGVCIMQMEAGLDTGPVFSWTAVPITPTTTGGALHDELARVGADLLVETIPAILAGDLPAIPQNELKLVDSDVTYAHKIVAQDLLLDWQKSAEELERQIRTFSPAPGCTTLLSGRRVKIFQCSPEGHYTTNIGADGSAPLPSEAGTVLAATAQGITVQCGRGALTLLELQLEGAKRLPVAEFIKGGAIRVGDRLMQG